MSSVRLPSSITAKKKLIIEKLDALCKKLDVLFVQAKVEVIILFTVVAMEVLIKYCINSFPKLMNSFDRKVLNFL